MKKGALRDWVAVFDGDQLISGAGGEFGERNHERRQDRLRPPSGVNVALPAETDADALPPRPAPALLGLGVLGAGGAPDEREPAIISGSVRPDVAHVRVTLSDASTVSADTVGLPTPGAPRVFAAAFAGGLDWDEIACLDEQGVLIEAQQNFLRENGLSDH
jgi:hypothetical protein